MPIEHRSGMNGVLGDVSLVTGKIEINFLRMAMLVSGLKMELRGMRLARGRSCFAIIKQEYGLKGNKEKVLEQFEALVTNEKSKCQHTEA